MNVEPQKIFLMQSKFSDRFGIPPNALIVPPNGELAFNKLKIKPGMQFMGMRLLTSDTIDDMTVGLVLFED
jgi:hypothetical protein